MQLSKVWCYKQKTMTVRACPWSEQVSAVSSWRPWAEKEVVAPSTFCFIFNICWCGFNCDLQVHSLHISMAAPAGVCLKDRRQRSVEKATEPWRLLPVSHVSRSGQCIGRMSGEPESSQNIWKHHRGQEREQERRATPVKRSCKWSLVYRPWRSKRPPPQVTGDLDCALPWLCSLTYGEEVTLS